VSTLLEVLQWNWRKVSKFTSQRETKAYDASAWLVFRFLLTCSIKLWNSEHKNTITTRLQALNVWLLNHLLYMIVHKYSHSIHFPVTKNLMENIYINLQLKENLVKTAMASVMKLNLLVWREVQCVLYGLWFTVY